MRYDNREHMYFIHHRMEQVEDFSGLRFEFTYPDIFELYRKVASDEVDASVLIAKLDDLIHELSSSPGSNSPPYPYTL